MTYAYFKKIVRENKDRLYMGALLSMKSAHQYTHGISVKKPEEPDFVASIVTRGIMDTALSWQKILSPYGIKTSIVSVFCHQRPIVEYNPDPLKTNPEIGDLLIVHIHRFRDGSMKRTALLLQAKMLNNHFMKVHSSDHQLMLYKYWPSFEFVRPKVSNLVLNISPKQAHSGAQYLLIDDSNFMGLFSCTYSLADTDEILIPNVSLSNALTKILSFEIGKKFQGRTVSRGKKNWSKLIWLLLEHSINKNFTRRNIKANSVARIQGTNLSGLSGLYAYLGSRNQNSVIKELVGEDGFELLNDYSKHEDGIFIPYDSEGISTILIETSYSDEG